MRAGILLGSCFLLASAGHAQPDAAPDFIGAARVIAAQDGIPLGEAVRRIKMQERILRLQEKLLKEDPNNFAGIEIVADRTRQRVRVKYKGASSKRLDAVVDDVDVRAESELAEARFSVAELLDAQSRLLASSAGFKGNVGVSLDFAKNGLFVKVKDAEALQNHLKAKGYASSVPLTFAAGEPEVVDQARVTGGRNATDCQTGFVVANYSGQRGVSSAQHCSDALGPQLYDAQTRESVGTWVYGLKDNANGYDVNWYTSSAHTYAPYIYTVNGEVRITSSAGLSLMPASTRTCISRTQPASSSRPAPAVECGTVYNPNYIIRNATTGVTSGPWVAVTWNSSIARTYGGDSGGPWFYGNAAMGIHKGVDGNLSLFTPVERLSKINVYVATN
jgi:hypothetical protein